MAATLIVFSKEDERLKDDLQSLRCKGILRDNGPQTSRSCTRCRSELGRIINRGAFCRSCRHRVCKNCREYTSNQATEWLCTVCHKHLELTAISGDWMNDFVHRPSKQSDKCTSAAETIKHSIQRSSTFSDTSLTPWSALRGSPELRAYSSMPRYPDSEFIPRTSFINRLNCNGRNTVTENNQLTDFKSETKYTNIDKNVNNTNSDSVIMYDGKNKIQNLITNKDIIQDNLIHEKNTCDPEHLLFEDNPTSISVTENEYIVETPLTDKKINLDNQAFIESIANISETSNNSIFRKVTLRKRRIDSDRLPVGVTPPRTRRNVRLNHQDDVIEYNNPFLEPGRFFIPDGEDYRLVFISSSDSSSREELQSDDASSTSSSLLASSQLDDCDWDYFEATTSSAVKPIVKDWTGGDMPPGSVVVAHRANSTTAEVFSQPSAVQQCSTCIPIPIPVPIPVPFPVLVPVSWHPDLTIRIEHSLAPLWNNLISQQLITVSANRFLSDGEVTCNMTEKVDDAEDKVQETLPREDDKSGLHTSKSEIKSEETQKSDNEPDGVVLKLYKTLEQNEDDRFDIECDLLKQREECLKDYMDVGDKDTDSSSTSEESTSGNVRRPSKRIYRFNGEDSDRDSVEDEDSSGEFSMGASPPASLTSASNSSSEDDSKHFKRIFVVNDSDSDIGELPEFNDMDKTEDDQIKLLKHMFVDYESNLDGEDLDVKLSSILKNCEDDKDVTKPDVDDCDSSDFIDLKSVLNRLEPVTESNTPCVNLNNSSLFSVDLKSILSNEEMPLNVNGLCVKSDFVTGQDGKEFRKGNKHCDTVFLSSDTKALSGCQEDKTPVDECSVNTDMALELSEFELHENNKLLTKEIDVNPIVSDTTKVLDTSDEEKMCETQGSNTSDEFSGTESMELEQGQIRSGGPVISNEVVGTVHGESWRETGRFTSLVMITQEHLSSADTVNVVTSETTTLVPSSLCQDIEEVHVVTSKDTLSAVVCLEEGLADDDSWVEEIDRDDIPTTTEESSDGEEASFPDREEELRGYHRSAIDFTLHTIVEESCEESEVETDKNKQTELEKYFFYGLGDGITHDARETDTMSETSSIYSEGLESLGCNDNSGDIRTDPADLASSRLEKYFLSGLMGYSRRDSDGSVGSDSEGRPSPEQRRKRLVRARGTGRQHSSSMDNLTESEQQDEPQVESEGSSTETDSNGEQSNSFDKNDGQFDTVKRTKKKKRSIVTAPALELLETVDDQGFQVNKEDPESDGGNKTPQPESPSDTRNKQQSRDSGFMGSCDDLLKESKDPSSVEGSNIHDDKPKQIQIKVSEKILPQLPVTSPLTAGLSRKDSFNNWSSDEETNLMMSKMRAFFKTMVGTQPKLSSPNVQTRNKPPQLVYFESELTRLMKTVPGIRDDQVREIVEYLSSEDTWSDSYDSSDYTGSDLESGNKKSALQEEISASCRQIISNFESTEEPSCSSTAEALVYQRLVASFNKIEPNSNSSSYHSSPPLIAKVMQHIGSRLVALMHEVSSGEGGSPKISRYHRRLQPKLSTSTTEDEEDPMEDYSMLPRSKSHDPLIEENRQEASDNERFSWRGSFESALMASDSRTRLASGGESSVSASALALAAKRRSAGDLLFKSFSREQLDRVRSCGSIGGSLEDKIWGLRHPKKRRSSVPDSGGSNDGDDDSDEDSGRSTTLPRSLQNSCAATNSLPRLPTSPTPASPSIYKANSVHLFNVKSARYRPPGYNSRTTAIAPPRRDVVRRRAAQSPSPSTAPSVVSDDVSVCSEPVSMLRSSEEEVVTNHRLSLGARSDSLASVYSGAGEGRYGSVAVKGEVEFGLQYNYKQGMLEIHVKQCRDLAAVDTKRNRSDPYVKVYLLPDKSKSGKRKTRVKKHTLNPIFEETLKFHITLEGLESRTLWLSVWHSDMFGRNDFLGEVTMGLENKIFDDPLPKFYTLQERSEPLEELLINKGELIVGLKFVPPSENSPNKKRSVKGALQVLVKEAKNLASVKSNGTSDPFCKSYLLPDKGRSSKQKTPVFRRSCSPAWNYTFTYYGVTLEELSERSLELTIWDHDRLASNEFLGGVRLNLGSGKHHSKVVDWMDSSGKETMLWRSMLEKPNLWVESCLPLRPSLDVRNSF
uniref:Synaptotagmin-like protein 5 n=2 Tax=Clastoptera arizonana TaxID=38151 RepID=A0A1B6CS04_9HEMI